MTGTIEKLLRADIDWKSIDGSPFTLTALYDGKHILLRFNDFPEESLCTVIVGDLQVDLDDMPSTWTIPRHHDR